MFSFLYSERRKMRQNARNWLEVAERVYHYRRDELAEAQGQKLLAAAGNLRAGLKDRADAGKLKIGIEALERVLRELGGRHYPVSSWVENVEFFLVAAIVILGIRAYFVQPFKIPTNSMWPSYYGMTHELFAPQQEEPSAVARAGRMLAFGARHYAVQAPVSGEVKLAVFSNLRPAFSEKNGRSMFVFPTLMREYTFSVGGRPATITVPADFDFERVLEDALRSEGSNLSAALQALAGKGRPIESSTMTVQSRGRMVEAKIYWIPLGWKAVEGKPVVSFDLLTGDLLFVDRFTYNFFRPSIGSGFVFKTGHIADLSHDEGDKYYIKRLVGLPGDRLEIRQSELWRNGAPIEGAAAFGKNARREGKYPGYVADGLLAAGRSVEVSDGYYFALGDNSPRSLDGRFWGNVPGKDVVGRPLIIYYPLTRRWGVAR